MVQTDHSTHLSQFLSRERLSHERADRRTTGPQEMRSLRGGYPSPYKRGSRRSGAASRGLVAGSRWATNPADLDGPELHGRRRVLQQGRGPGRRGRSSSRPASRRLSAGCRRALDPRHRRTERERLHPGGEDQPDPRPAQTVRSPGRKSKAQPRTDPPQETLPLEWSDATDLKVRGAVLRLGPATLEPDQAVLRWRFRLARQSLRLDRLKVSHQGFSRRPAGGQDLGEGLRPRTVAPLVQIVDQQGLSLLAVAEHQVHPCPRLAIVSRGHLVDVRQAFQPGQVGGPSFLEILGKLRHVLILDIECIGPGLEVFGEPLIEPEGKIAIASTDQGVSGLVPKVLLESVAQVRVDNLPLALREEEGPARRQLGIIELEEVRVGIAIVEDIDLDGLLVRSRVVVEPAAQVGFQRMQATNRR